MRKIEVHPGAILRRELKEIGLSANALSLALGVPSGRITGILNEKRAVTPDTAVRLAEYFGGKPEFWLNIQVAHDLSKFEAEKGEQVRSQVRKVG